MSDMNTYENILRVTLSDLISKGVTSSIFGDIFLEDLRLFRETKLSELKIKAVFSLWQLPTEKLVREFIALGFKAITTCVDEQFLDKSFVGRMIDTDFLKDLPKNVDSCGENGEFHSFVFDGPIFKNPVQFEIGEKVLKKYSNSTHGFWFCDLISLRSVL